MGKIDEHLAREAAAAGVKRAVETGTYLGESAIRLSRIFERVETIELSPYFLLRSWLRLLPHRNVNLRFGNSATVLRPSREPTLYWLDGHWSAGRTAGKGEECPLLKEIHATAPGTHGDWYLIDDASLFTKPAPPPLDPAQWPSLAEIEALFHRLRPGYEVRVHGDIDVIVARPQREAASAAGHPS